MDRVLLLSGLPVTLSAAIAGVWVMSRGGTLLGVTILGLSVIATMFVVGSGMPRPIAVPRPGEEDQY